MKFQMVHNNFNVLDLDRSLEFYRRAFGMHEVRRINAKDGSFIIVYLEDGTSAHHDVENAVACDFLGIASGNSMPDKIGRTGFHTTKSKFVDAPVIDELPFTVECRVKSYDAASWRLVGEIVNVSLDERILGEDGKVSFAKFHPLAFDWMNNIYLSLGEKVGNAYRDGLRLK